MSVFLGEMAQLVHVAFFLLLALGSALSGFAAAKELTTFETLETFEAVVTRHKIVLAAFVREGDACQVCDMLVTELESAADFLDAAKQSKHVTIIRLVTDRTNELAIKYGVSVYPTMKVFRDGSELSRPYRGGYTGIEIANYLRELTEDPSQYLETLAAAQAVVPDSEGRKMPEDGPIVVFGFFKHVNADMNTLRNVEDELRDTRFFNFVHASTDEVLKFYGHRHTFVVYNPQSQTSSPAAWPAEQAVSFEGAMDFIAEHGLPLAAVINSTNSFVYRRVKRPVFRLYADLFGSGGTEEAAASKRAFYLRKLREVARAVPEMVFTVANVDFDASEEGGLPVLGYSKNSILNGGAWAVYYQGRKFRPDADADAFDAAAIEEYAKRFFVRQPLPYLKSQALPQDQKPDTVVTLVGRNFRETVFDEEKVVLTLVYAPWCGHCQQLLPLWEQLGREIATSPYGREKGVVVAQIDATANELPRGYIPSAYPTVVAALPGQKYTPREYAGERTLDAYVAFIDEMLDAAGKLTKRKP